MSQKNDLHIRLTEEEKTKIEENSIRLGFHSVSEFVRYIAVNIKDIIIKVTDK